MSEHDPGSESRPEPADDMPADPFVEDELVEAQQREHLRRILIAFLVVVVLLPFTALGDLWTLLLVPMLLAAWRGLRHALLLRRSVRLYGAPRGR